MEKESGKMKPQLIIPMTGVSQRFTAAGYRLPKFLLKVNNQTVIEHVLDLFPDWEDVIFCCNEEHLLNPDLNLKDLLLTKRPKAKIVSVKPHKLGPGWAVLQAKEFISQNKPVVVNYCDFACFWSSDELEKELNSGNVDGCIPAYTGFHPHMNFSKNYAYLKMKNNLLEDIQEKKPWTENPNQELASSGTYGFASGEILLSALQNQIDNKLDLNGEFYFSLTYKPLLADGRKISTMIIQHFMQWGTPQDFEEYVDVSNALEFWDDRKIEFKSNSENYAKIILASGSGTRFSSMGYEIPKPMLPLSGVTVLEHAIDCIPGDETVIVSRNDVSQTEKFQQIARNTNARVVNLFELTRGQAESTLFGLSEISENVPVTINSCDSIHVVESSYVYEELKKVGAEGLLVWVPKSYKIAERNPDQYGWIESDSNGNVIKSWIKSKPDSASSKVISGTFSFGSRDYGKKIIQELISHGVQVNGEFYLDSLVDFQLKSGKPCRIINVPSFVSVGTPQEYESLKYWQSCFDKWPMHPYKLINDPMVPGSRVMQISKEFRQFEPEIR
jgi:NDP-sugar pyrophosphorylase family protein